MQVLICNESGLKMYIHARKWGFWGILPVNGKQLHRDPQKAPFCAEQQKHVIMMYRWLRSVQPFLHRSPFYPVTPKSYAL